jgi:hypothetical protein
MTINYLFRRQFVYRARERAGRGWGFSRGRVAFRGCGCRSLWGFPTPYPRGFPVAASAGRGFAVDVVLGPEMGLTVVPLVAGVPR